MEPRDLFASSHCAIAAGPAGLRARVPMSDPSSKLTPPAASSAQVPSDPGSSPRASHAPRRAAGPSSAIPGSPIELLPAEPSRVLEALEAAVRDAETGDSGPLLVVRPEDMRGLGAAELRPGLDRLLTAKHADVGLDALLASGILEALMPEVGAMVGFGDGEWRHKDVWKHTKQVVIQAVPRVELRWAALLHDIGKVKTRTISDSGEVHFFGHAEVGARMFDKLERRVKLFSAEDRLRQEVRFLVLHHLRAGCYDSSWTDSAVRRFAKEMGPHLDGLLLLSRADMTTKRPEKKRAAMRMIQELSERIGQLAEVDARVPPLPKGLGDRLMREFGIPPSRQLGSLMRVLEVAADSGEIEAHRDADYYVNVVAENRARFGLAGA
jgi:poly(A) polymerase